MARLQASTLFTLLVSLATASLPQRPAIHPSPYQPGQHATHISPARLTNLTCTVPSSQNASAALLTALQTCNNGGTVLLPGSYTLASPLDLTFLSHIDIVLSGTISFTDDIAFWTSPEGAFNITYQNSSTFWRIGGEDVNIYGGGTLNGNGETWWDAAETEDGLVRPILFVVDGLKGGTISGLNFVNPPNVSIFWGFGKKKKIWERLRSTVWLIDRL